MKIYDNDFFDKIRSFESEDTVKSYSHLLVAVFVWLCSYLVIFSSTSVYLSALCVLVSSGLTVRIFILYHDYCHGSIFKNKVWIEKIFFDFFGVLIFFPVNQWTKSHNEHHAKNSILNMGSQRIIDSYFEGYFVVVDSDVWKRYSKKERMLYRYRRSPFAILFGLINFFIFPTLLKGILKPLEHVSSWFSIILHIFIGVVTFLYFSYQSLLFIYLSLFVATAVGSYIFYAQHNFPGAIYAEKDEWDYLSSSVNATSFFKMSPVLSWVTGNIGYHHIHHINSKIPFYRLPEVDAVLKLKLHVTTWRIKDLKRNFSCNVWDKNKNKFLRYHEVL
jgi:omega-6 fatty acid desaturase (delta-12 desaturase)